MVLQAHKIHLHKCAGSFLHLAHGLLLKVLEEQQLTLFSFITNFTEPHKIEIGGACNKEESHILI